MNHPENCPAELGELEHPVSLDRGAETYLSSQFWLQKSELTTATTVLQREREVKMKVFAAVSLVVLLCCSLEVAYSYPTRRFPLADPI